MKTKFWLFAAALSLAACSQNDCIVSQPQEPAVSFDDFEAPDGRVVVQLGTGGTSVDVEVNPSTRAAYENIEDLISQDNLGIFALAGASSTEVNESSDNKLLENIQATIYSGTLGQADGAEQDNLHRIRLKTPPTGTGSGTGFNGVYYYPMSSKQNFTFYGYAPFQQSSNDLTVTFNYESNMDILYAKKAAPTINKNEITVPDKYATESEFQGYNARYLRVLKYNKANHGEHKPWVPNLNFNHKMTLLKIYLKPAEEQTEDDKNYVKTQQTIRNVLVNNHPKQLKLDILNGDLTDASNGEKNSFGGYRYFADQSTKFSNVKINENDVLTISDGTNPVMYFLVYPQTSYDFSLIIKTNNQNGVPAERTEHITIKRTAAGQENKAFEAGKSYAVKLGIFAAQSVEITTTLSSWGEDEEVIAPIE